MLKKEQEFSRHLFTLDKFTEFLKNQNINFIGGHNIVNYDIPQLLYNQGNNTYECRRIVSYFFRIMY